MPAINPSFFFGITEVSHDTNTLHEPDAIYPYAIPWDPHISDPKELRLGQPISLKRERGKTLLKKAQTNHGLTFGLPRGDGRYCLGDLQKGVAQLW